MARIREFVEVVRFFRIEAESRRPGASRPNGADVLDSGQTAAAGPNLWCDPGRGGAPLPASGSRRQRIADVRLAFDSRLAERLAAWSIRWARAQIRAKPRRDSQFGALRSHVERMASLEDGRAFADALERANPRVSGAAAPALPASSPTSHGSSASTPFGRSPRSGRDSGATDVRATSWPHRFHLSGTPEVDARFRSESTSFQSTCHSLLSASESLAKPSLSRMPARSVSVFQ